MSTYTGSETLNTRAGGNPSSPTFIETFNILWDDKYDPAAPLELPALAGRFVACVPALMDSGHIAIAEDKLTYDAQSSNFHVGYTVTGATSGATGLIMADEDAGTTGKLTLANRNDIAFIENEVLADDYPVTPGAAVADIVVPVVRCYVMATTVFAELAKDVDLSGVKCCTLTIIEQ